MIDNPDLKELLRRQVISAAIAHRSSVLTQFMSGRWRRRDGDVYGIVTQSKEVADADRPPGDIRSPNER